MIELWDSKTLSYVKIPEDEYYKGEIGCRI
jgi:hypothetical protein